MKTIDILLEETGLAIPDLARRAQVAPDRLEAIAMGRWTPSPSERQRIADALGVPADQISWGHTLDPRNVRYRRFGFREGF